MQGLDKIIPDTRDYSLLHTFAGTIPDPEGLPDRYSNYDGRAIPDQNADDARFPFLIPPLPFGCTGEAGAFDSGIQDKADYNPQDLYLNTPPRDPYSGRDIRKMLQTLIDRGPKKIDGSFGPKRLAYFNCYGSGKIDDFDAARIALWINQFERRNVIVGTWWYQEFNSAGNDGILPEPSYQMAGAQLHCHLVTGFDKTYKDEYVETIPWRGKQVGKDGLFYMPRSMYNALMRQPWTGAFTITKQPVSSPIPVGYMAVIDHLVYMVRNLWNF